MLIVHVIVIGTEHTENNAEIVPSWFYFRFLKVLCCYVISCHVIVNKQDVGCKCAKWTPECLNQSGRFTRRKWKCPGTI